MENKLVKAEILWTRSCPLSCSYCGMKKDEKVEKDWNLWKIGLDNLIDLGARFFAVYGAEPLADMKYLPELFMHLQSRNVYHTLITSCVVPDVREKLDELYKAGLRSLTVSYDGEGLDKSSKTKSSKGLETLRWMKDKYELRDASVVFTLTKKNLNVILDSIKKFAKEDIYVFFDLIHSDIGNPGTKCRNYDGIEDLLFQNDGLDRIRLTQFAEKLLKLKNDNFYGKYVHQSKTFISMLLHSPEVYIDRTWNCARYECFPSWVSIDHDGRIRPCDDFYVESGADMYFWVEDFEENFREWSAWMKYRVQKYCRGCFWATHFDAHQIKMGVETFENYMNNKL